MVPKVGLITLLTISNENRAPSYVPTIKKELSGANANEITESSFFVRYLLIRA
jgi:hypothetical protein